MYFCLFLNIYILIEIKVNYGFTIKIMNIHTSPPSFKRIVGCSKQDKWSLILANATIKYYKQKVSQIAEIIFAILNKKNCKRITCKWR